MPMKKLREDLNEILFLSNRICTGFSPSQAGGEGTSRPQTTREERNQHWGTGSCEHTFELRALNWFLIL